MKIKISAKLPQLLDKMFTVVYNKSVLTEGIKKPLSVSLTHSRAIRTIGF
jgi:hypothetical protein